MSAKIKKILMIFSYVSLVALLVFLVYEIIKEKAALRTGFTKEQAIQKKMDEQKNAPKFNLSDNVEVTKTDCLNFCQKFKNNSEDYSYCQNLCQEWLNENR